MIFEGKITKTGSSTRAYDATGVLSATHLKAKGADVFYEITQDLVIKRVSGEPDDSGENVYYADMKAGEQYVCIINGQPVPIETEFYAQIAFMKESEKNEATGETNGTHYRCDDGVYVRRDEIQVPAYKKVSMPSDHKLTETIHNGRRYTYIEYIELLNGSKIDLPNDNVVKEGEKYFLLRGKDKIEGKYYNRRVWVENILINDDTIVDISKLQERDGKYVVDGFDEPVGVKEISIENPFVEGTTIVPAEQIVIPHNLLKQRPRIEEGVNLAFVWAKDYPGPNGLLRIDVNKSRTWARFTYADGHQEVYAEHSVVLNLKEGVKEHRIQKLNVVDLGQAGIKFEFFQKKNNVAQNVEFKDGQVSSYMLNDNNITDIKWREVDGYKEIASYVIDGVLVSDIEWHAGEVKRCKLHLQDEQGNPQTMQISDLKLSKYKNLAITCKLTDKIENVKTEEDKISFKLGKYEFKNAELTEEGKIDKCIVKYDDKEEEIDLSKDKRFEQLSVVAKIKLNEQKITPLMHSQLLTKKNGKYELVADVVQTGAMSGGKAKGEKLTSVEQAVKHQERFRKAPYKTVVIDPKGKVHQLSDFNKTYEGTATFESENDIIKDILNNNKFNCENGKLKLDTKKVDDTCDQMTLIGFALCSNPITLVFGVGMLVSAAVTAIVTKLTKAPKVNRVKTQNLKHVMQKIQDDTKEKCQENINELTKKYAERIKEFKSEYSIAEFNEKLEKLKERYIYEYYQEVAKLQMLGRGSLQCEFDLSKKTALTPENYLAYLLCMQKREEVEFGKKDHPDYGKRLREIDKLALSNEDKIIANVELMQELGGCEVQKFAHEIKLKNIKVFLAKENKQRKANGQNEISKEDYIKQLNREYYAGALEWGGVNEKLNAYQHSEEYLLADKKGRKKLLENKKKELEKELNSVKVDRVEFDERLNKQGNPLVEECTAEAMAYLEEAKTMFNTDVTGRVKRFSFGHAKSVSKADEEVNAPTMSLADASAVRANSTFGRRLEHDKKRSVKALGVAEEMQTNLSQGVSNLTETTATLVADKSYEEAFKVGVALKAQQKQFREDCLDVEAQVKVVPNAELITSDAKGVLDKVNDTKVKKAVIDKRIDHIEKMREVEYKRQVEQLANDELVANHNKEYKAYVAQIQAKAGQSVKLPESGLKASFVRQLKSGKKKESVERELATLKVKHHIVENIEAEVHCEQDSEQYIKFIEKKNIESKGAILDPDSELAKCYYYAECKNANPREIERLKKDPEFAKKFQEIAEKRLKKGALGKHDDKKAQSKRTADKSKEAKLEDKKTTELAPKAEPVLAL